MKFMGTCDACGHVFTVNVLGSQRGMDRWVDDENDAWGTWAQHKNGRRPACESEFSRVTSEQPLSHMLGSGGQA